MSKLEPASDPSMEDILASIRRIISDDDHGRRITPMPRLSVVEAPTTPLRADEDRDLRSAIPAAGPIARELDALQREAAAAVAISAPHRVDMRPDDGVAPPLRPVTAADAPTPRPDSSIGVASPVVRPASPAVPSALHEQPLLRERAADPEAAERRPFGGSSYGLVAETSLPRAPLAASAKAEPVAEHRSEPPALYPRPAPEAAAEKPVAEPVHESAPPRPAPVPPVAVAPGPAAATAPVAPLAPEPRVGRPAEPDEREPASSRHPATPASPQVVAEPSLVAAPGPTAAVPPKATEPMRAASPPPTEPPQPAAKAADATLLSARTDAAVETAFNQLAGAMLGREARSIEDVVKDMMRPMLKDWLDENLPSLVERLVREEIQRVSRGRR